MSLFTAAGARVVIKGGGQTTKHNKPRPVMECLANDLYLSTGALLQSFCNRGLQTLRAPLRATWYSHRNLWY